jgi:hypothetical protein
VSGRHRPGRYVRDVSGSHSTGRGAQPHQPDAGAQG